MFSSRTHWDLTPNPLATAVAACRRDGRPLLDLTESNPTRCGFAYPAAQLLAALSDPAGLRYDPEPRGLPGARAAIASAYARAGVSVPAEAIVLTTGTSESYAFLLHLLCDAGDEVLVPSPSYPLFDYLAGLADVRIVRYPLRYRDRWEVDLDALRAAAGPRSRAVVVVNPNNPTGSSSGGAERGALLAFCRERGLALIADEVFADYPFDNAAPVVRFAGAREALTFSLGGLSKSAGLPQMKIGWIVAAGPEAALREALARLDVVADTVLSVGTFAQLALPEVLRATESLRGAICARLRRNRGVLLAALVGGPGQCLAADGGWYAVWALPGSRTDDAWALEFLQRDGVLVHPGHFYDFAEEGRVVLSLLAPPETFDEGIRRVVLRARDATA